jgi:hypothetical protein
MGMAGFARSGQGRGTAGVSKVNTGEAQKAGVARGMESQTNSPRLNAETATRPTVEIPRVDPPALVPVLSPPRLVDLAATRPSAEARPLGAGESQDLGTKRNVDAKPMKTLPKAQPTLPQTPSV